MSNIEIVEQTPGQQEHHDLRAQAGLSEFAAGATPEGLAGSWFAVVARDPAGRAVGMGRLVGDGALFQQVVDMAVDPDHQGHGVGSRILARLLEHVDRHAPDAYVSLIAVPPGQRLYPRFGFLDVAPASA